MKYNRRKRNTDKCCCRHSKGAALVFAMIALAVLTSMAYAIVMRLAGRKHRQQYLINYQKARYACDSATKVALDTIKDLKLEYADRTDQPDFSDLFWMNKEEYSSMLESWSELIDEKRLEENEAKQDGESSQEDAGLSSMLMLFGLADPNSMNMDMGFQTTDPNTLTVPGPYGPVWPLVAKPEEMEIGDVKVIVSIEDENAKLPVTLAMLDDKDKEREKEACFMNFFEWMGSDSKEVDKFLEDVDATMQIKKFSQKPKEIKITEKEEVKTKTSSRTSRTSRNSRTSRSRRRSSRNAKTRYRTKTKVRPNTKHMTDYALVINSEFDMLGLDRAIHEFDGKRESLLKYLGIYGSSKVNINTAPRHVLEGIFSFGGDADYIADQIILERMQKPFESIDDLKQRLYSYSDSIDKCKEMILTESIYFTVHVKAISGSAVVENISIVIKVKNVVTKLATISN